MLEIGPYADLAFLSIIQMDYGNRCRFLKCARLPMSQTAPRTGNIPGMKAALETLLKLRDEGLLAHFAIGGAIAASYYVEAVATEDLDVFAFLTPSPSGLLLLGPLYERLRQLGGRVQNEHVVIGTWPVQILPAYTPLVEEAVMNASDLPFENVRVPVVSAEHLCAIALQTGRAKDYARVNAFIDAGAVDRVALRGLIDRHALTERWTSYERRYS